MPELPEAGHVTLPPDWVCEIVSDSARRRDLHEKQPVYAREGVGHLWVVELTDRTLEAFELHEGEWVLIGSGKDDDPVSIRPSMQSPSTSAICGPEGMRTVACLTGGPGKSQSRAPQGASHPRLRPKAAPIGRISGREGGEAEFT